MDRFKFRIPVYDNENKFVGFTNLDIEKGIAPYNYGKVHHEEKEQCIGLKDKNGNLIYEGDVLKAKDLLSWVVIFKNGMFCGKCDNRIEPVYDLLNYGLYLIGNIHENPELLEK